eukprot:869715-Prymnesium_polylepis.2
MRTGEPSAASGPSAVTRATSSRTMKWWKLGMGCASHDVSAAQSASSVGEMPRRKACGKETRQWSPCLSIRRSVSSLTIV